MNNHQESSSFSLPFVTPVVRRLDVLSQELLENSHSTDILRPSSLTQDRALSAAFALLVLLQFRDERIHQQRSLLTPWDRWTQESEAEKEICIIDKHIERVWEQWFLDAYCSPKEIETVLWTAFPLEEDKDKTIRVVDFLAKDDPPVYLLTHRVVQYSLFNYWKRGPSVDLATARHYLTTKYDAFCTPRTSHFLDLLSRLVFFALLASYTLEPPRKPSIYVASLEYIHAREILLVLLGVTIPWAPLGLPFALTTLAFVFNLPSVPFPPDFSFNVLLVSLFLLIFQFHIPVPPSPVYLLQIEANLPFILLLCQRTLHIFTRVFGFFLPALLLSFYLLSLSLVDNFLQYTTFISQTPMQSRGSFLFLSVVVLVLIGVSFFVLAPVPLPAPVARQGSLWDVYSKPIGITARVNFVSVLLRYSEPYLFPPPFNLVYFILVWIPRTVLRILGASGTIPAVESFRRILWRILVGPVMLVATICTLWAP